MKGTPRIDSDAFVALCHAIDAAIKRGDTDEAIRLSAMQAAEMNRWLKDHGYPLLDYGDDDGLGHVSQVAVARRWPGHVRGKGPFPAGGSPLGPGITAADAGCEG